MRPSWIYRCLPLNSMIMEWGVLPGGYYWNYCSGGLSFHSSCCDLFEIIEPLLLNWLHLTHWGRNKMAAISKTTLSIAFSSMKMFEFRLKFHWSFVPKCPINNIPALVQIMAWCCSGNKPLSESMVVSLLTHICVTRPQCVKRHHGWVITCPVKFGWIHSHTSTAVPLNFGNG